MIKSQYTFLNRDTSTSPWIQSNLELWEQVLDARDILCIPEKQTVFWQGDPAAAVYVVQRGRIILTISNRRGEEKVLMYAGKGCIIGEQALEKGEMYSYSAMTMEESCFYRVKAEVFLEYLNSRKDVVMALILNQMDKSKALTSHIADLSFDSAKNRLVRELLYCAEQYGGMSEKLFNLHCFISFCSVSYPLWAY